MEGPAHAPTRDALDDQCRAIVRHTTTTTTPARPSRRQHQSPARGVAAMNHYDQEAEILGSAMCNTCVTSRVRPREKARSSRVRGSSRARNGRAALTTMAISAPVPRGSRFLGHRLGRLDPLHHFLYGDFKLV